MGLMQELMRLKLIEKVCINGSINNKNALMQRDYAMICSQKVFMVSCCLENN